MSFFDVVSAVLQFQEILGREINPIVLRLMNSRHGEDKTALLCEEYRFASPEILRLYRKECGNSRSDPEQDQTPSTGPLLEGEDRAFRIGFGQRGMPEHATQVDEMLLRSRTLL